MVIDFAGATAPTGFLACDGSAVSRTTYADLFTAIGTTWGTGDGSTTFNLPDLRGAFVRGTGSHGSETMADGNAFAGPAVGAFEDDQMQGHRHRAEGTTSGGSSGNYLQRRTDGATGSVDEATFGTAVYDTIADGNGTPRTGDETRPFAAGVLKCIKT
jgi:microcystin-dependent protein